VLREKSIFVVVQGWLFLYSHLCSFYRFSSYSATTQILFVFYTSGLGFAVVINGVSESNCGSEATIAFYTIELPTAPNDANPQNSCKRNANGVQTACKRNVNEMQTNDGKRKLSFSEKPENSCRMKTGRSPRCHGLCSSFSLAKIFVDTDKKQWLRNDYKRSRR